MNDRNDIVLVGDGFVGKTSIVNALTKKSFDVSSNPNIINETEVEIAELSSSIKFNMIDTAGQEEYDFARKESYEKANLFLLCFCVHDFNSFDNIRTKWAKELDLYKNVPKILISTKCDEKEKDFIKRNEIEKLRRKINCVEYIESSAKTLEGIETILQTAYRVLNTKETKRSCVIS
ncbi:unnamed protein product [Brassicogethes aeneus]|uniref:Uncharacterized protein n=1 Tax=Brassicogethes aeneus TaxID=1431903 RepID=A0A9P0FH92_BRAAE|nr:unnamed protein product [Brassicogethes aeneus]